MTRFAALSVTLAAASLLSACVFAPPVTVQTDSVAVAKMSEQATATCGAGNVREVSAKSFTCK